jgi:hypothetical protein
MSLAALTVLIVAVSIWRGLRGWPYRLAAGAVLLAALLNPSLQNGGSGAAVGHRPRRRRCQREPATCRTGP